MSLEITTQLAYAKTAIGKALAQGLVNIDKPGKPLVNVGEIMNKARSYALGSTAKFFRLGLRNAFKTNPFGWRGNREHPNWLGLGIPVDIGALIKANKPRKVGKAGYSKRSKINPPRPRTLGGKLPRLMFHQIDERQGSLIVGMIPAKLKGGSSAADVFRRFQVGGDVNPPYGDIRRMRGYLGALGIPMKRTTWSRPARPLIAPMINKYPPQDKFEERFLYKILK